jgi:4-alpha-glucanotransferase
MTTESALEALAAQAGLSPRWTDNSGAGRIVAPEVLAAALEALGLPADSDAQVAESRARLEAERAAPVWPTLITTTRGAPTPLPAARPGARARVEYEAGGARDYTLAADAQGCAVLPGIDRIGYHRLLVAGQAATLAVAPGSALTIGDVAQGRKLWGLAAQIYGLRRAGDGGFGDFGAVAELCEAAARRGADLLALSPAHALYAADPHHFAPYSPSSRLFANALHADPTTVLGAEFCAPHAARHEAEFARARASALIDWPLATRTRLDYFRALFDAFLTRDLRGGAVSAIGMDFARFRAGGGHALERHAIFEALHADQFGRDVTRWAWRDWPADLRDAASPQVAAFAREHAGDVLFHTFLQWLVDRSLAAAQGRARDAGMRVGLVADLAIGMSAGGSHAWSEPGDLLLGLSIGAPPDALAPRGQNWGLTTFSPRALRAKGFAPFLATLRAALRNCGGVRIDHIMGVARLWLTPDGCEATDGVYLSYPADDLLALLRLESARHGAVVIGEDLGTVPHGLRDRLGASGIAGLRVMLFERDGEKFYPPHWYPPGAVAMPTTHDTATFSGWWRGCDIAVREAAGQLPIDQTRGAAEGARAEERAMMWRALAEAGTTQGAPCPAPSDPAPALDAAMRFLSASAATLVVAPLEDALGLDDQPNLPGTTDEHPNWRRRYPGEAATLLDAPQAQARLAALAARG